MALVTDNFHGAVGILFIAAAVVIGWKILMALVRGFSRPSSSGGDVAGELSDEEIRWRQQAEQEEYEWRRRQAIFNDIDREKHRRG